MPTLPLSSGPRRRIDLAFDAINFLLADVRGATGPYLNLFLITQRHWSQSDVGLVTTLGGLLALVAQTPIGALIDRRRDPRLVVVLALAVLAAGGLVLFFWPGFWPVLFANALMAVVGDIFAPAVAALTLHFYPAAALASRLGRNAAWDHAGNIAIAGLAGLVGSLLSQRAIFLLAPLSAVGCVLAVLMLPAPTVVRSPVAAPRPARSGAERPPLDYRQLLDSRPLLILAGCALLFHLANAPLLPLVGQKLADAYPQAGPAMMTACIIAAQAVMLPLSLLAGHKADSWGRKPLLLCGFAILPLRAVLYTLSDNSVWLIAVQILDGVGAGLFGVLTPLVVADLMGGSGCYTLALGAVATAQAIGAALSGLIAGLMVDHGGYRAAFLAAAAIAAVALIVFALWMPETAARRPAQAAAVSP